jgi:hypothetical protein
MVEFWAAVVTGLSVLGGLSVIAYSRVRATMVDRRIVRMMVACGIEESIAGLPDRHLDIDMNEVRQRCRACTEPETCERFLSGAAVPDNGFCPNAARFRALAEPESRCIRYDPGHRPGRRLDG